MAEGPSQVFAVTMRAMSSGDEALIATFYSAETTYWDQMSGHVVGMDVPPNLAGIGRQMDRVTVTLQGVMENQHFACLE